MSLNFVLEISGKKVVLDMGKLEVLWDTLHGAEVLDQKWVGTGKGTAGSNNEYQPLIGMFEAHKDLTVSAISQEQIDAIKFCMKQQEQ